MKNGVSIKFWVVFLVNLLFVPTILLVSLFFYQQFKTSIDERVLLQLTSIKGLKRVQIEDFLEREWQNFEPNQEGQLISEEELSNFAKESSGLEGIHDVTGLESGGFLRLAFVKKDSEGSYHIRYEDGEEIKKILLERTGMGKSGESYLVGEDFKLRSRSRFFPERSPYEFECQSEGVLNAFEQKEGKGIYEDYRGIEVYGAYQFLNARGLKWAILSEIDTEEALEPLLALKKNLIIILVISILIIFVLSLFLAGALTRPLLRMKYYLDRMSGGDYDFEINAKPVGYEMNLMYDSLSEMVAKFKSTISFSKEIGEMNLAADYKLIGENDTLGKSLLAMKEQLRKINETETQRQRELRSAIVSGQEKERLRLSKELHDGLGPMLTHLKLMVQSQELPTKGKDALKNVIDDTVNEVRRMTFNLMPQSLMDFGVAKSVQNLVLMLKPLTDIQIEFIYHSGEKRGNFGDDVNICLFRITQECLNNGIKHSVAENIVLVLTEEENQVNLYYSDDGKGFDVNTVSGGSGLSNMRARTDALGGTFVISSAEEGTTIDVTLPFQK
ncbi:ATP-binding protein [uncultured Arcticibacterium sp.]|uniref:ATP-binding protein n=1 Tax=uncultured Arcticibacterium sp. TaxID=2173042 RepID=UPI0030F5DA88